MKRLCKAMLIFGCSIAIFASAGVDAEAQEDCEEGESFQVECVEESAHQANASDIVYYDSVEEVGAALRESMKAREETIEVGYTTTEQITNSIIGEFMEEALKHTGVSTEGDYLRGHYKSYKASASGSSKNGIYNWVFTYTVKYHTTAAQEKATDEAVAKILSKLDLDGKASYMKIKLIYDYLCNNITYDWENKEDDSNTIKYTAYAAAVEGTSVCKGYTLLFYRLLLENGIDVRMMEGTGNGEAHSWNIVKVDNLYYYADATWDSAYSTHEWFLKGTDEFSNHIASSEFTTASFTNKYPISATQYWYDGEHDHEYITNVTAATFSKSGKSVQQCFICGNKKNSKTIAKVKSVTLSTTVYTYDGEKKGPAVTVEDANGNALVKGTDFKVTYASGRKNVGKYSVKVTLVGNYSGSKTLYFKIRPKATSISSLTAGSKCFTVKYNKRTTQTTGYQIQYSTSSSFDSAKSVYVSDNTTVSKKIKSLKASKKYYVRVRTYKTVKINGESTKIYSAWSATKSVKTKS